jgi:hypothetical protein
MSQENLSGLAPDGGTLPPSNSAPSGSDTIATSTLGSEEAPLTPITPGPTPAGFNHAAGSATNKTVPRFTSINPDSGDTTFGSLTQDRVPANLPNQPEPKRIRLALSLGSTLMELRGRVLQSYYALVPELTKNLNKTDQEKKEDFGLVSDLSRDLSEDFYRASTWRGLYSRALSLYQDLLNGELSVSRYGLSADKPVYLSDSMNIRYISIGLDSSPGDKFELVEKLRRALNFLLCLYQQLDDCDQILEQVFGGVSSCLTLPGPAPQDPAQLRNARYSYLLRDLTDQINVLILAWDSTVREQLFAYSNVMLMARYGYSAGRDISEISWSLTSHTARAKADITDNEEALRDKIYEAWLYFFSPGRVANLQRQLSALIVPLENEYQERLSQSNLAPKPASDGDEEDDFDESDLKSPRTSINSVIQSLEYWQLTVLEMSELGRLQHKSNTTPPEQDDKRPLWEDGMKLSTGWSSADLIELQRAFAAQSNNWFDLVAGRQNLASFKVSSIATDLVQNYREKISGLVKQNLLESFGKIEEELANVVRTASKAATNVADAAIDALSGFFNVKWLWVWIGLVLLIVLIIGAGVYVVSSGNPAGGGLTIAGILQAAGLGWSMKKLRDGQVKVDETARENKDSISEAGIKAAINTNQSLGALVLSSAGQVRQQLEQALNRGFKQLRQELALISATVALTGPLAEFVANRCNLQDEWQFLNDIIWNDTVRRNQLERVVTAAFGSTGAFLLTESGFSDDKKVPVEVKPEN